uniref:Uncharacterized protein n=1 Tax=Pyxicephalus adspersus TaxID=30357 RepID=A0AAV3AQ87_PYXAD|nr:TPA: hypothetical protein GDO54_007944 [Pyxicephalus adspersus]
MATSDLSQDLSCSSCVENSSDLIVFGCGHTFCPECFVKLCGGQEMTAGDTCPVCENVFPAMASRRPYLEIEARAEVRAEARVENPETTEILCTHCIGSPVPALQSCLHCEASLCADHLQVHTKSPEHILTKPTNSFQDYKCPTHQKILDLYCCEDELCICLKCHLEEHKAHQVLHFHEEFHRSKKKLEYFLEILSSESEEIQKRLRGLRETNLQERAADVTDRISALFGNLREQQEDLERKILEDIAVQEKQISLSVSDRIRHLEKTQRELSGKTGRLSDLYNFPDPLKFSRWMKSDNQELHKLRQDSCEYKAEDRRRAGAVKDFDEGRILEAAHTGLLRMVSAIRNGIYVPESTDLLLDLNTAANNVAISEDLKELWCPGSDQCRAEREDRFDFSQVLSTKTFRMGRHYWDLEVGQSGDFRLGVAYSTM